MQGPAPGNRKSIIDNCKFATASGTAGVAPVQCNRWNGQRRYFEPRGERADWSDLCPRAGDSSSPPAALRLSPGLWRRAVFGDVYGVPRFLRNAGLVHDRGYGPFRFDTVLHPRSTATCPADLSVG